MAKSLFEQYRPATLAEVVGQSSAMDTIGIWKKRGMTGRACLVTGSSGTGKTTICRAIARENCDEIAIREIDAGEMTESTAKEEIRRLMPLALFGAKQGRCLIVNEFHRMRKDVVGQFLTLMEPDNGGIPDHVLILFTSTSDGLEQFEDKFDAKPFISRCNELRLARRGIAEPFAQRAAEIAITEGLAPDGATIDTILPKCIRLAKDNANNLRKMLCHIEDGALLAN